MERIVILNSYEAVKEALYNSRDFAGRMNDSLHQSMYSKGFKGKRSLPIRLFALVVIGEGCSCITLANSEYGYLVAFRWAQITKSIRFLLFYELSINKK